MKKNLILLFVVLITATTYGQKCDTVYIGSDIHTITCYDSRGLIKKKDINLHDLGRAVITYIDGIIHLEEKYSTIDVLYSKIEYTNGRKVKKSVFDDILGTPIGEHYYNGYGKEYKTVIYKNGKRHEFKK